MTSSSSQSSPLLRATDVRRVRYTEHDRALFDTLLHEFVPPNAFDAHAHLYDLRHLAPTAQSSEFAGSPSVDHGTMIESMQQWMGERVVREGLYFPFPAKHLDKELCDAANTFLVDTLREQTGSRALMLIRPQDDPDTVESRVLLDGFVGFKVYHVYAERKDTFHAEQGEFLPEWAWELAQRHSLVIMMHMVLPRALSDERNQKYIREHCRSYPDAKLILAHAGRGFNARHTVDGIASLRGVDNVYFDTSAICEAPAFEAILRTFGPSRLMYGSDFPISEMRGRSLSVGDGFFWLYDHNTEWDDWPHAKPELVGIESLLALQQACRTMCLRDRDIERIFGDNARLLLGLRTPTDEGKRSTAKRRRFFPAERSCSRSDRRCSRRIVGRPTTNRPSAVR